MQITRVNSDGMAFALDTRSWANFAWNMSNSNWAKITIEPRKPRSPRPAETRTRSRRGLDYSLGPLAGYSTVVTIWQLSKDKLTLNIFGVPLVYIVLPHQKTMTNPVSPHFHHTYSLFTFSLWFHLFSPPPDHAFTTLSPINQYFSPTCSRIIPQEGFLQCGYPRSIQVMRPF